ncbi:MAG TPA: alternative ribosome rescue aminoacyl-tRNA hydrolase ArfB, partial [Ignavibacteria bacterium]|nr:alternative ribosome rescue aminoacyl-tRNA hydrolase ArfB [Ignavibacteria bacterium]
MNDIDIIKLLKESKFNFSRSGGKGGQNVNKVETKVELVFNIPESLTISGETKMTLLRKLKNKVDKEGNIRLYAQTERSQLGNRKKVIDKFTSLIKNALKREPIRIKTKEPVSSKLERLDK